MVVSGQLGSGRLLGHEWYGIWHRDTCCRKAIAGEPFRTVLVARDSRGRQAPCNQETSVTAARVCSVGEARPAACGALRVGVSTCGRRRSGLRVLTVASTYAGPACRKQELKNARYVLIPLKRWLQSKPQRISCLWESRQIFAGSTGITHTTLVTSIDMEHTLLENIAKHSNKSPCRRAAEQF